MKKINILYALFVIISFVCGSMVAMNFQPLFEAPLNEKVAVFADGTELTWKELQLKENGDKYKYKADKITNTEIGEYAFTNSELLSITLPKTIDNVHPRAFYRSQKLTSIKVANENKKYAFSNESLYERETITLLTVPCGISGEYTVANGTKAIHSEAFSGCLKMPRITVPLSVQSTGKDLFKNLKENTELGVVKRIVIRYVGNKIQWDKIDKQGTVLDVTDKSIVVVFTGSIKK